MRVLTGIAGATLLLGGCGGGADPAVEACAAAASEQLQGRDFVLDRKDMAAKLTRNGDRGEINSSVLFNQGLPNEIQQTFTCVVQYDATQPGAGPAVTSLQFQW